MTINIITINTTASIPLFQDVINFFINTKSSHVNLTEIKVKEYANYQENLENISFNYIAEYDSYSDFMNQSLLAKVKKYIVIIKKIISVLNSKQKQIIYSNDFQVLSVLLLLRTYFRTTKTKIIYHQFELIEKGKLNLFNQYLFKYLLRKVKLIDLIIFPEINRLFYFVDISNFDLKKTFLLPNSCEIPKQGSLRKKHKLFDKIPENSFIVGHIGHIGGTNFYLSNFISAIEKLKEHENIYFLFIGRQSEDFKTTIQERKLRNVITVDFVPHSELKEIYPFIDLGVILYRATNLNTELCAPNKLYELWSNGIPVIAHKLKGLTLLFDADEKGMLSDFEEVDSIVRLIISFSKKISTKNKLIIEFEDKLALSNYFPQLKKKIENLVD